MNVHLTDRQCVEQIKANNSSAFDVLYMRYKRQLHTFVYALVLNYDDAEDAVSQTFEKLWERSNTYHGTGSVKSWLFAIARNEAYSLLRKRPRHVQSLDAADGEAQDDIMLSGIAGGFNDPRDIYEAKEVLAIINAALRSLSPKHRCVYLLRWRDGLSYCEIAERLHIPLGTVKSRMDKATKYLSKRVGPYCNAWRDLQCKRTRNAKKYLGTSLTL
jgi:RNA polymerase sigma-70 factor (ECF subfamily)